MASAAGSEIRIRIHINKHMKQNRTLSDEEIIRAFNEEKNAR